MVSATLNNAIPPCGTGATCLSRAVMYIFKGSIFLSKQLGRLIEYGLHNIVSVPNGTCGTTPGADDLKLLARLSKDGERNFRLKCLLNYAMQPKFAKVE